MFDKFRNRLFVKFLLVTVCGLDTNELDPWAVWLIGSIQISKKALWL